MSGKWSVEEMICPCVAGIFIFEQFATGWEGGWVGVSNVREGVGEGGSGGGREGVRGGEGIFYWQIDGRVRRLVDSLYGQVRIRFTRERRDALMC